mmetsp:Transcript_49747/g.89334  ORF Transcript_49747/g.89334 Transcript_49747/m.89334 type:complete len:278 (+) Transcript_49747:862-1695(+)
MPGLRKEHGHLTACFQASLQAEIKDHRLPSFQRSRLLAGHCQRRAILSGKENTNIGICGADLQGLLLAILQHQEPCFTKDVGLDICDLFELLAKCIQSALAATARLRTLDQRPSLLGRLFRVHQGLRSASVHKFLRCCQPLPWHHGVCEKRAGIEQTSAFAFALAHIESHLLALLGCVDSSDFFVDAVQCGFNDVRERKRLTQHGHLINNHRQELPCLSQTRKLFHELVKRRHLTLLLAHLLMNLLQDLLHVSIEYLPASSKLRSSLRNFEFVQEVG